MAVAVSIKVAENKLGCMSTLQARTNVGLDSRTQSSLIIAMHSAIDGMVATTGVEDISQEWAVHLSKADLYAL